MPGPLDGHIEDSMAHATRYPVESFALPSRSILMFSILSAKT